jgi:rhodanese-related sulfurtransferase
LSSSANLLIETPWNIDPVQAQILLQHTPGQVSVIDVREPWEWEIVALPGARLWPLGTLLQTPQEILEEIQIPVLTLCHHGVRSLKAAQWLRSRGILAQSIHGGIDAWARLVDTSLPVY